MVIWCRNCLSTMIKFCAYISLVFYLFIFFYSSEAFKHVDTHMSDLCGLYIYFFFYMQVAGLNELCTQMQVNTFLKKTRQSQFLIEKKTNGIKYKMFDKRLVPIVIIIIVVVLMNYNV